MFDSFGPFRDMLCGCHREWEACEVAHQKTPLPRWLLIAKKSNDTNVGPGYQSTKEFWNFAMFRAPEQGVFVPTAAELIYLHHIIRETRSTDLNLRRFNEWCSPVLSIYNRQIAEMPRMSIHNKGRNYLVVYPQSAKVEAWVRTARLPDK